MVDRVVKVKLTAQVQEYIAGMERASQATRDTGTEAEKLGQQREAFTQLGTASMLAGGLMAAGLGVAVTKAADFDKQMSKVNASTHESVENMALLRAEAIRTGADSVFTASESANAIDELAKAGVATSDILGGGLQGSLDLAAAGELGVADAAEIAATAMTQFKLAGQEVPHVADLLAAGAGKAQGSVSDLSQALNQGGLVASQTGLSIEETVGGLSAFASAGLLGSDAGTSFKSMLQSLTPTSKEAANLMKEYNLEAYDAQGNFIGLAAYADKLKTGLAGMTVEQQNATLKTIFGSDAVRAASVLYDQGADGIQKWIDAVDDAGYAAETAALKQDNLAGDVEKLGGAFDSTFIQAGSAANGVLRDMTQNVTEAVDWYNELPVPLQQGVFWLGALTTAVVFGSGAYMVGVPKIAAYRIALATMGTTAQRTGRILETSGKVVGFAAAGIAVTQLTGDLLEAGREATGFATSMDGVTRVINDFNTAEIDKNLGFDKSGLEEMYGSIQGIVTANADTFNWMTDINNAVGNPLGFGSLGNTLRDYDDALTALTSSGKGEEAAKTFQHISDRFVEQGGNVQDLTKLFPSYTAAQEDAAGASKGAADGADQVSSSIVTVKETAEEAEQKVADLADAIANFNNVAFGSRDAARDYEQSLDDLEQSIAENGATLDITTQEGRDNQEALDNVAKKTLALAGAIFKRTGSEEEATAAIEAGREALKGQLATLNIVDDAAEAYIKELGLFPDDITMLFSMPGVAEALADMANIVSYDGRDIHMTNWVETIETQANRQPITERFGIPNENGGFYDYAFENGGFAPGIYPGGRPIYKLAEENVGWEAFISGKAGQEQQNIATWAEAGRRLGVPRESQSSTYMESTTFHVTQNNPTVEPSYKGVIRSSRLKAGSTHV